MHGAGLVFMRCNPYKVLILPSTPDHNRLEEWSYPATEIGTFVPATSANPVNTGTLKRSGTLTQGLFVFVWTTLLYTGSHYATARHLLQ